MGITLFISEKPSLGHTVASSLGVVEDKRTHVICKNGCVVAFAQGHLFELLEPQEYDPAFKHWRREDLPLDIPVLKLKLSQDTARRYEVIKSFLKDAERVVHVGDPDREGQRIVDDILEQAGWKGPVERLWNTDQSERGMAKTMAEFANGFPSNDEPRFRNRSLAAKVRAEVDWRLGMNISRAIGIRLDAAGVRKPVSYGRLQSTVLAIIVAREKERKAFKPKTFYSPKAVVGGVETEFVHDPVTFSDGYDAENYLVVKAVAQGICDLVKGREGEVVEFERKRAAKSPPLPYDISRLIQDANKRFGISAKETNDIAQSLYEKGITTYPRVDCRYLPEGHFQDARRILDALAGLPGADMANPKIKGKCFNTKKTDEAAHHAIVPTGSAWAKLSGKEMQVFRLVAGAYILQFHPDQEFETQKLAVRFDGPPATTWRASGRKVLKPGWTAVDRDADEEAESTELPEFKKGTRIVCDSVRLVEGETKKPPAFTEASIMSAMENVDRFEPNPAYKKLLKDAKGIGTGATRGTLLDLLCRREFITIEKGVITPTEHGTNIVSYIPEALKSPALTAIMEGRLEDIVQGRADPTEVVAEVTASIPEHLDVIDKMSIKPDKSGGTVCPACGKAIARLFVSKQTGKPFWKCLSPECGRYFQDNKGHLVAPVGCPKCGEKQAERFESKRNPGTMFWHCRACDTYFRDEKGKIGRPFDDTPGVACPQCGKGTAKRYESKRSPGTMFWVCDACKTFFSDENGKIGAPRIKETAPCPKCKGTAQRFASKKRPGTMFWVCDSCKTFFSDENGKIGKANDNSDKPKGVCPACGGVAVQLISKKGNPFWICEADKSHGPFADDNGKPGAAFGTPPKALAEEMCPHCKKQKALRLESRNKPGVFYWQCKACGNMSDDDGKPGRLYGPRKEK